MISIPETDLPQNIQEMLTELQRKIDTLDSFEAQVASAKTLWKSKGGVSYKPAFVQIQNQLRELCQFEGVCMYCEHAEATDIEHVFPKSYFPSRTFVWTNYLLACKTCNSGYKLDACSVLDANQQLIKVPRGNQPPSEQLAFLNPRGDNPEQYLWLNLETFTFEVKKDIPATELVKAEETLNILALNNRDVLIAARKAAYHQYYFTLRQLAELRATNTVSELIQALTPNENRFDLSLSLPQLKRQITEGYRTFITQYQHPSVWQAIKEVEAKLNDRWKSLFDQVPEALTW